MIASLSDDSKQSARQRIDRFVQRFDDSYRKLAYYAALPLVLTPELLNYLRNQFLRGEVPWVAEIDLLLSDLCSPTGYEQYVMDTAVRAVLLEEIDRVLGRERMEAVARLLIDYVRKLARTTRQLGERSLEAQQWAAMVYLDDQRQTAVQQIARSLQKAVQDATTTGQAESQAGLPAANQAELAQLARITQKLAPQLGRYTNLLDYAKVVSQLLVARTSASSEMLERSYSVEGIELRLPVVGQGQVKIAQPKVEGQSGVRLVKSSNTPKTILLLAANPKGTTPLRLDEEVREIDAGLQRARNREQFILEQKWAVRPRDIYRAMLEFNPSIVHFSGHGTGDEGLIFEDETGIATLVDGEALAGLFELFADQVECVVLDGCYSEVQATAIARHVNYVIGMNKAIGDQAAIEFAVAFYDALGAEQPVEFAHKLGCAAIRLAGIPEQLTPILKKKLNIGETVPKTSWPPDQPSSRKEDTSVPEALDAARAIQDEYDRADALSELAPHLPPELLQQALDAARAIQSERDRARALSALASKLPPDLLQQALDAARAIQDEYVRVIALSALASKLPPDLLQQALDAARAIQDEYVRVIALNALASKLPGVLPEALAAARAIQSESDRADALSALADKLPEVLPEALAAARAIQSESDRVMP